MTQTDRRPVLLAVVVAGLLWGLWRLLGVDLEVGAGDRVRSVGLISVLVATAVVSLTGLALLGFLGRRTPQALRIWTGLAVAVLLLSALGPLGATTTTGLLALLSLHLAVGLVVIVAAHRATRRGVA